MAVAKTVYACGICKEEYPTAKEAGKCEASGKLKWRFKVGDIVLGRAGFGWFDGDVRWVENYKQIKDRPLGNPCPLGNRNCFLACCTYRFYYVVTLLDVDDRDKHRARYHVMTKAMTGKEGQRGGYTFDSGHITLQRVIKSPKFLIADSKDLLGKESGCLL